MSNWNGITAAACVAANHRRRRSHTTEATALKMSTARGTAAPGRRHAVARTCSCKSTCDHVYRRPSVTRRRWPLCVKRCSAGYRNPCSFLYISILYISLYPQRQSGRGPSPGPSPVLLPRDTCMRRQRECAARDDICLTSTGQKAFTYQSLCVVFTQDSIKRQLSPACDARR